MDTAIKHPVVSFIILTSGYSDARPWASECPDVKNCKWRLNLVWHRMLYSSTHMATVGVKGLNCYMLVFMPSLCLDPSPVWAWERCRISPPCFLADCLKRRLNQASFVLFAFWGSFLVCVLSVFLICLLSCIFHREPTWMALYSV